MRIIAIDWSGAKSDERSKIWLAEIRGGELTRLECGRSRDEVITHVVAEAERESGLLVGLDFAFSFPEWFLTQRGMTSVETLWSEVGRHGEEWLACCDTPFWGRPGKKKPDLPSHLRVTEVSARVAGIGAKSVFQIGGAGAVGTGSLRGMPYLETLHSAGFAIWPFHEVRLPLVIEIYPRLLTGPVKKSSPVDRERYLASGFPEIRAQDLTTASSSEDAFDAAISAVVMARHREQILGLERASDRRTLLEGRIWSPVKAALVLALDPAPMNDSDCSFCARDGRQVVVESADALAIRDRHPVSRGHTLILPKTHTESLFAQPPAVQRQIWELVGEVRTALASELGPDGFTIGINDGRAAGQTVPHAHVHVIPRFEGDVPDPRGGIRWVLPEQAPYWAV